MRLSIRLRRMCVAGAVVLTLQITSIPSVLAECTSYDRWPSFRSLAPTAETVFVGHVVEGLDYTSAEEAIRFIFRVDEVLRGEAEETIRFDDVVRSGLPNDCPDSTLGVHVDDIIAFAIDAPPFETGSPLTAVAFIRGAPNPDQLPGVETITRAELRRVLDLPATDAIRDGEPEGAVPPTFTWVALVLAALAGVVISVGIGLRHRRSSSPIRTPTVPEGAQREP